MSSSIRKQLEDAAKKAVPTATNRRVLGMQRKAWMEKGVSENINREKMSPNMEIISRPSLLLSISGITKKIKKVKAKMVELRNGENIIESADEIQTYNDKLRKLSILKAELIYLRNML